MHNNRLKQLRSLKRLTQKDVAQVVDITTSYYGMIENGTRLPNLIIAYNLAVFFETSIEDIFFYNIKQHKVV